MAFVPLVVGLSVTARRSAPRSGHRRIAAAAEGLALVVLCALALGHPILGLAGIEKAIAAGLLVLLGLHLRRRLLELRPALDQGRRPAVGFFLLPLAAYLAILPWSTLQRPPDGDEPWYLLIAHSLAYDRDTDLANNYQANDALHFLERTIEAQPGDPEGPNGERYSRHTAFLPAVIAPLYLVGGRLGALATMAVLAALMAWATLALGRLVLPEHTSGVLLSYALLAFLPPLLLYSGQVWVEVPAGLMLLAALGLVRRLEVAQQERGLFVRSATLLVLVLVALPLLKLRFAVFSASIVVLALLRLPRWRAHLAVASAIGGAFVGAYLLFNWIAFGNPLRIHLWRELWLFDRPWSSYLVSSSGLLFDVGFGLFACAPLWTMLLLAPLRFRAIQRLATDTAILALPYLLLVASRVEWYGGWSPPFRYPLTLLPLFALLLVPLWQERRSFVATSLLTPLWLSSVVLTIVWVITPGLTYNFADGRSRLLDLLTPMIGADLVTFLPSSTRPRTATWLFPLVSVTVLYAWWLLPRLLPKVLKRRWRSGASLRPLAALAGTVALILVLVVWGWAAKTRVTRSVEVESPHVRKSAPARTHMDPPEWTFDRRRFREAWVLPEGERMVAPINAGGSEVVIAVEGRLILNQPRRVELEIHNGDHRLGSLLFESNGQWRRQQLGPVPWRAGEPLTISLPRARAGATPGVNGVAIDRVDLLWVE